ncbi:MAG: peptide deformylase [Alphaproteobacteria bacterium]|jgi:peptide deformylase|nr:peptide deformylase [Alphaproteobacteria bacterium]MBT5390613.1 peptide deformylase [Alphaproteobacteria bacterium]MBT5654716.1 peptide deformylase [Alphaproteobacteria bacterium]
MTATVLKIMRMGQPILLEEAAVVKDPTAPEIHQLVADMRATVESLSSTGLAAPQVDVSKRVILFRILKPTDKTLYKLSPEHDPDGVPLTAYINPVVEPLTDEMELSWEACLSLPGLMGKVSRYTSVRFTWQTLEGKTETREAHGFHARVIQHECDHLDGILYPMRMTDFKDFGFIDEIVGD